ncbi:hypothetical protein K439DRAFT_300486 [Ramaria rubella]|nr:hypothetical protein K439DRAFT_300486 [Ramaria rubella]
MIDHVQFYEDPTHLPPPLSNANIPHALTSVQERRLTDYLDEKILGIQREYKKRSYETSSLRTLHDYVNAAHPLLTIILLIPPIDASVHLRASLLLRLTGELLECLPGYPPESDNIADALDLLDELDQGWLAVLRSQTWNPDSGEGVDLILPSDANLHSPPISQTDRTRLRSLLLLGTDKLEVWLEDLVPPTTDTGINKVLEARQRFDDLFHRTLTEMGELQGTI